MKRTKLKETVSREVEKKFPDGLPDEIGQRLAEFNQTADTFTRDVEFARGSISKIVERIIDPTSPAQIEARPEGELIPVEVYISRLIAGVYKRYPFGVMPQYLEKDFTARVAALRRASAQGNIVQLTERDLSLEPALRG